MRNENELRSFAEFVKKTQFYADHIEKLYVHPCNSNTLWFSIKENYTRAEYGAFAQELGEYDGIIDVSPIGLCDATTGFREV